MSLKAFHIVFILISTAFTVYFGIWSLRDYLHNGATSSLLMSIGALVAFCLLVVYFRWFLRKLKNANL
jgi:uncharacterized membrane protein